MTNHSISMTIEDALQPFMQPYVRLTQRNMQLFTSFSASPEMVSLWLKNGQEMFSQAVRGATPGKTAHDPQKIIEQAQGNLSDVAQSKAFAGLLQGLMQSHLQFLADLAQTNMAALSRMPTRVMKTLQQATAKGPSALAALKVEQPRRVKRKEH